MRRLLGIALICLVTNGCAIFTRFENPVTIDRLANIESAYGIALSAAVAYRNIRLCKKNEDPTPLNICSKRNVILQLQSADRSAQVALTNARAFVKEHPYLDAFDVLNAAQQAVSTFQAISYSYGVK